MSASPDLTVRSGEEADLPAVLALYGQPDFNGDNVLTIVNGAIDAGSVALCFARVSDDGQTIELVGSPSAELPSSSTLTLESAIMPLAMLVLALRAKRPNPPPGNGFCPAQRSVSRSDAASAESVPSTFSDGRMLI